MTPSGISQSMGFTHELHGGRVVFGTGALARLPAELAGHGWRRVLVLSTPGQVALAERVAGLLGPLCAGSHAGAAQHVPVDVVRAGLDAARAVRADACVAVGGGSTIGLAKAIALRAGLPSAAIPTTYAGSEMTPLWGITEGGVKTTGRDPIVLPRLVLYDPELTRDLPPGITIASGLNALAHAIEGLWAPEASPLHRLIAEEGARAVAAALRVLKADPRNPEGRAEALYGAWLCGTVLGNVLMGLHHQLCHVLGGAFSLPHAETHAVLLPHVAAFNAPAAPEATRAIARALGATGASPAVASSLSELVRSLDAPSSLREIGAPREGLGRVAERVAAAPYPNPVPVERAEVLALLERAWAGAPPSPSC